MSNFGSQPSSVFGHSQNGHDNASDKLVNISVNIDEAHLVKHIQQVVARSLQHTRQEVQEMRNSLQRLAEELSTLRKETLVMHDVKLRAVVTTLIDVRSAVTDSRTGAKAYLKAVRERRERQDSAEAAGVFDPESLYTKVGDQRRGEADEEGRGDDVDLDSERISSLEVQCSRLREHLRVFTEEESPAMMETLSTRIERQVDRAQELMTHLGLEFREEHRGVLHSLQSVAQSAYMKPVFDTIENNERRVRAAEETARNMCTKAELSELRFAVSDLRGSGEATKAALHTTSVDIKETLQSSVLELKGELAGKVAWFDMDQWKNSVNDAFAKSKQAATQQQKVLNDVSTANADVRRGLDDLSVRVAELVVAAPVLHAPSTDRHPSVHVPTSSHHRQESSATPSAPALTPLSAAADQSQSASVAAVRAATSPEQRAVTPPPTTADSFSGLLDGVDSTMRKRIQEATQAAYYAYADAGRAPANVAPASGAVTHSGGGGSATKARPRSALLMRK